MTEKRSRFCKRILHIARMIFAAAVFFFCTAVFFTGLYIRLAYPNEKLEELLFYLSTGAGEGDLGPVIRGVLILLPGALLLTALLFGTLFYRGRRKRRVRPQKRQGRKFPLAARRITAAFVSLALLLSGFGLVGGFSYLFSLINPSDFLEDHYTVPRGAVTAPEKMRNLIVIELESMETTLFSREEDGIRPQTVIPELYALLELPDAISFSTGRGRRGTAEVYGSTWTTAAIVAYTSGLPFKVPSDLKNSYHSDHFMQGAYTLGDVLADFGYDNTVLSGSAVSFGGVGDYFSAHGAYDVIDRDSFEAHGFEVPESQRNKWGFSDEVTFRMARRIVEEKSAGNRPFHLFISTIDTHFTGYTYPADPAAGYRGTVGSYSEKLNNVYATTSREVGSFIDWLRKQPCYENTAVVLFGDHLNMTDGFCTDAEEVLRGRYEVFLNSSVRTERQKGRVFTALDFYPTVLAAAGFTVRGDRLALGVNLFSAENTLAEQTGLDRMNGQLAMRSRFYEDEILGDDAAMLRKRSNGS